MATPLPSVRATMYESFGNLEYHDSGWLILKCCEGLAGYYRSQIRVKCLGKPRAGSHVTVVNGDVELNADQIIWKKHQGRQVRFQYNPQIKFAIPYYWLTVHCKELHDIREELGLARELKFPLHLTLARIQT